MHSLTIICRISHSDADRNSRSPEHVPVVDSETFAQCKELMRPVQKKIIEFGSDTDPRKSSEVQVRVLGTLTIILI